MGVEEFDYLHTLFAPAWQKHHQYFDLKGHRRKIPKFKEDKKSSLPGTDTKLFFILCYLKNNALQDFVAFTFSLSQGKVSQWVKVLLPILEQSLGQAHQLPATTGQALALKIKTCKEAIFYIDVTERSVPRSIDKDNQEEDFSGKQHAHTTKNLLFTDNNNHILFVSESYQGSVHDKKILDETPLSILPQESILFQDLGFMGHQIEKGWIAMGEKKPKNKPLNAIQKACNHLISSFRVSVEHTICGVKRLRIIKDRIRLKTERIRDRVMLVACGLHNLRNHFRKPVFS